MRKIVVSIIGCWLNRKYTPGFLLLLAVVFVVAFPHILGQVIFIGDADRLNTFLNIKLAEVIGLKELGGISAWNPNSFMGFNLLGLYWTLPGWQPDSYLHALFPIESFYRNAGLVTFGLLLLSMSFAYVYLHDLTNRRLASLAGACCFGLSSLSLGRLAQVDTAYYSIMLMPLAMLAVRRLTNQQWAFWGAVLASYIAIILGMGFLQEAAYILMLLGVYCAYTAIARRRWSPVVIFCTAFFIALLISGPRLLGVAEEFSLMFRTTNQSGTGAIEILRIFHDGIFGRYFSEAWGAMSNEGFNPHEGLQLYSSTIATCILIFLGLIIDFRRYIIPIAIMYAVFVLISCNLYTWDIKLIWIPGIALFIGFLFWVSIKWCRLCNLSPAISINSTGDLTFHFVGIATCLCFVIPFAVLCSVFAAIFYKVYIWNIGLLWLLGITVTTGFLIWLVSKWLKFGHRLPRISIDLKKGFTFHGVALNTPQSFISCIASRWQKFSHLPSMISINSKGDATFHILAISVVLAFILLPVARNILYQIFFRVDFLHARIVIDALIPFAAIVSLTLAGFADLAESSSRQAKPFYLYLVSFIVGVSIIAIIHYSVFFWQDGLPVTELRLSIKSISSMNLSRAVTLQVLIIMGAFCFALLLFWKGLLGSKAALILYVTLSSAVIAEGVIYAHEKLFGEQTRTFPVAFQGHNYLNVPGNAFSVPTAKCRNSLGAALESGGYRSVSLGDPNKYYAFTGPHLSQFWQLKLLDGYPGLPKRLAALPWVPGVVDLRSLVFRDQKEMPWELLSILGVKYAVPVSDNLYYNQIKNSVDVSECPEYKIDALKNPFNVIPRQFFAGEVVPYKENGVLSSFSPIDISIVSNSQVELSWWLALRDGDIEVQMRPDSDVKYHTIGRLSPISNAKFPIGGLIVGKTYFFRLHKLQPEGKLPVFSDPISFRMPLVDKEQPVITKISRIDHNHALVFWKQPIKDGFMRIEVRRGIDDIFTQIADIPASKGFAKIKMPEPMDINAVRIQSRMNDAVSPHSKPYLLGSSADYYSPLIKKFFISDPKNTALVEGSIEPGLYFSGGPLHASYRGDIAQIYFDPSDQKRFLVINEMFHPRWTAKVDGVDTRLYPTNYVMTGIPIPADAKSVELEFHPILKSFGAKVCFTLGLLMIFALFFKEVWHRFWPHN